MSHEPDIALCTAPTTGYSDRYMTTLEDRIQQELHAIGLLDDDDNNNYAPVSTNSNHEEITDKTDYNSILQNHNNLDHTTESHYPNNHSETEKCSTQVEIGGLREVRREWRDGQKKETDREDDEICSLFRSIQNRLREQKAINDHFRSHLSSLALIDIENYQKELAKRKEFRDTELAYASLLRMKKKQKRRASSAKAHVE